MKNRQYITIIGIKKEIAIMYKKGFLRRTKYIRNLEQKKNCTHCGKQLIESDLKDYKYLCINCDKNFYGIEVE